ncbi:MAG: discoidin domain-containing protein, partial [Kiritimatiellaeota bacterium]|nr:discoidin domain-containing protein [Kiritimatiellota bacterium]
PDGTGETGDFTRESSARDMGPAVDLPVLPANINRHETYTIPRTGEFIAPLIQGQARYVRVQLDTPDTAVELDSVVLVNSGVYDHSPHDGYFLCSNAALNRLWYFSTWTLQIASFPNHDAWKTVDGWVLPRKLERADEIGLSVDGKAWGDVTVETSFELRANPHHVSAAGVAFRAQDARNAYKVEFALNGVFRLIQRNGGVDKVLSEKKLAGPLTDGARYHLQIEAKGNLIATRLDGVVVDETRDDTFRSGRVGFYTPKEKWPLFDSISVKDGKGRTLLEDDFAGDLSKWQFARTLSFVADGGKRDRLVWSGDLYFAQRNVYYAFARPTYMRDSLKMLAFNQTPEGYVQACPYPETSVPPVAGDYGPFPSDEFAAWLVPVAWEHLLYTDDIATLKEIYPALKRLLGYLGSRIGADGLFVQDRATSKHAGNLDLGDTRQRAYMNVLLWGVFSDAARIADRLGYKDDGAAARQKAGVIRRALFDKLWDESRGWLCEAVETRGFGAEANALALSMGLLSQPQAERVAKHFRLIGHGKFQALASRGLFTYGFGQPGMKAIYEHNWMKLVDPGWQGATTTTECMGMGTRGWGDESHPDTAIAYQFSAYLLGVVPLEPGFRRFQVRPLPVKEVSWARGLVPTPHGAIDVGWEMKETALRLKLTVPGGTEADVVLPGGESVLVNSRPGKVTGLGNGSYDIEVRGIRAVDTAEPVRVSQEVNTKLRVAASSSHEEGGWGAANLAAPESDKGKKGYSSAAHDGAVGQEWVVIDLGEEATLKGIVLVPRGDVGAKGGGVAGFPRDFTVQIATEPEKYTTVASFTNCPAPDGKGLSVDLYTVIGYPKVRRVKIHATRFGEPASDEAGVYRMQLERVRIVKQ